jgi:hypothetical protein
MGDVGKLQFFGEPQQEDGFLPLGQFGRECPNSFQLPTSNYGPLRGWTVVGEIVREFFGIAIGESDQAFPKAGTATAGMVAHQVNSDFQ